jgi:hypothetical protein
MPEPIIIGPCDTYTHDEVRNEYLFCYRGRRVLLSGECGKARIHQHMRFVAEMIEKDIEREKEIEREREQEEWDA